jgi:signal recognition particle subunit SRP54
MGGPGMQPGSRAYMGAQQKKKKKKDKPKKGFGQL